MAFDPDAYLNQKEQQGFDPDAYLSQSEIQDIPETEPGMTPATINDTALEYAGAAAAGGNEMIAGLLGIPADTVNNVLNLARAGYGTAKHMATGSFDVPETVSKPILGSEWIKEKTAELFGKMGGGDPFQAPDPTDPIQQDIKLGSGVLTAGMIAPSTGIKQTLSNVGKMAVPAAGAVTGKELFPDQPLAPLAGMLLAPAAVQGTKSVLGKMSAPTEPAFIKAHKLGYRVPPSLAKRSISQQAMEGTAGPVPTKQRASIFNQKNTNRLIKKDLGYPDDVPLSKEGLDLLRAEAGKVYEKAKSIGVINTDLAYKKELSNIAQQNSAVSAEFPSMVRKDITDMVKAFNKKSVSSNALVDVVKQLRSDSSAGYRSADPGVLAVAKAKGKLANAMEGLMERQVQNIKPELLPELRAARQRIAKSYTVEKALKGENVDAVALGRELDKGKPLSGLMRDVADFGRNFKGAAQVNIPQQTNFRPMDLVAGIGGSVAMQNPAFLSVMAARPALRTAILSKPYQAMLARARPAEINQIMKLSPAELAAIIDLANQSQADQSGTE